MTVQSAAVILAALIDAMQESPGAVDELAAKLGLPTPIYDRPGQRTNPVSSPRICGVCAGRIEQDAHSGAWRHVGPFAVAHLPVIQLDPNGAPLLWPPVRCHYCGKLIAKLSHGWAHLGDDSNRMHRPEPERPAEAAADPERPNIPDRQETPPASAPASPAHVCRHCGGVLTRTIISGPTSTRRGPWLHSQTQEGACSPDGRQLTGTWADPLPMPQRSTMATCRHCSLPIEYNPESEQWLHTLTLIECCTRNRPTTAPLTRAEPR